MTGARLHEWRDSPEEEVRAGVRRRSISGEAASMTMIEIAAGTVADRHNHPHEQFVQVLSGRARVRTDDSECEIVAGSILHLPPGTFHSAVFDEDTVLVEINVNP